MYSFVGQDIVESAKFTLAELAAEAVSWLRQQREKFLPYGVPLSNAQKMQLNPFFTLEILDAVRIVNLPQTGESIPNPPFFEKFLAGRSIVLPDLAHTAAVPFIDVAVFNTEPTPRSIFHTLVHVTQFALVGVERVMEGYLRALNKSSVWAVVPFEEQAYHLDARYSRNPAEVFSVEEEVREWLRSGRYHKE
jgi:hypothetical protein